MAGVFSSSKSSKSLEIHLDSPLAVFHGDAHDAEPVAITGRLVLKSAEHMNVKSVKLKLEGKWRVSWVDTSLRISSGMSTQCFCQRGSFLQQERQFIPTAGAPIATHRITPGRHEWRFRFTLDASSPESIEGVDENFVAYNLIGEIDRGYMSKTLSTKKHVRVIRALGRDMTEMVPFPYVSGSILHRWFVATNTIQSNEDSWANKVRYHIYIPTRYYALGSNISVDFTLLPLRKGVKISKIKMEVLERITLNLKSGYKQVYSRSLPDKIVASMEQDLPNDSTRALIEEMSGIADESYHFTLTLPLKKSLDSCRPSMSSDYFKVNHVLKIFVNIINPDGHTSQLFLRNKLHLFISPQSQINDNRELLHHGQEENVSPYALCNGVREAPPTYGTHLLDPVYQDIDVITYASNTPSPINFQSRSHSKDTFPASIQNALPYALSTSSSDTSSSRSCSLTDITVHGRNRLTALQDRRSNDAHDIESGHDMSQNVPTDDHSHNLSAEPFMGSAAAVTRSCWSGYRSGNYNIPSIPGMMAQHSSEPMHFHPCLAAFYMNSRPALEPTPNSRLMSPHPLPAIGTIPAVGTNVEALDQIPCYDVAVKLPYRITIAGLHELPSYDSVCALPRPGPAVTTSANLTFSSAEDVAQS